MLKKGEKVNYYIADIHFGHDNIRKYSRFQIKMIFIFWVIFLIKVKM